jgi:hypothetical protein
MKANRQKKDKRSKKVEKHVKRTFEEVAAANLNIDGDDDILYNRVIVNMKRLLKKLTGHSNAIDSLERKLRDISAPKKKKKAIMQGLEQARNEANQLLPPDAQIHLNLDNLDNQMVDDLDGDNMGMRDYQETPTPPEYRYDELDKLSEGNENREILMDQIRMVEVDKMGEYNKFQLPVDSNTNLKINDSDELESVSSEDSGEPDKELEDDQ